MTYANMKPLEPEAHSHIADWVKKGGVLIYSGTDNDPFQNVREWWNTNGHNYATPSAHLFEQMGLPAWPNQGEYSYGKGTVCVIRTDPKDYVLHEGGDKYFCILRPGCTSRTRKRESWSSKTTSICKGEITTWLLCLKRV